MMNTLRENAKFFLWIILIAFGVTIFALWGARGSMGGAGQNPDVVAKLNSESISYREIGTAWRNRLQELYDKGIKVTAEVEKREKKKLLDNIINRRLKLDYAKKLGVSTTDEEVARAISSIPAFRDEQGNFKMQAYQRFLYTERIPAEVFENEQKERLILMKLRNFLWSGVRLTDDELRQYFIKRNRKIKTKYVYFNYNNYPGELKIGEERMKDYYAVNKQKYAEPPRVKASHILIRADASPTSPTGRTEEEAKKLAAELVLKISRGASFSELAKKYSQDPGTAEKGGELGWFEKGMMVPDFEKAAFKLEKGEISKPVKTQYGYHIIKAGDRDEGFEPTFEKVRDKVLAELKQSEGMRLTLKKAEKFSGEIKNPGNFSETARDTGLKVYSTGYFTEETGISGIDSETYKEEVFDLNENSVSTPVKGENGYYVFKVTKAKTTPFDENEYPEKKDGLKNRLKTIKFSQLFDDLIARLREKADIEIFEQNLT